MSLIVSGSIVIKIKEKKKVSVPVYPEHVAGANDGSCFSDTDTYKEIIAMERENTILCAKLDKLIEEGDGFDV